MGTKRRIVLVHGTFAFDEFDDAPSTNGNPAEANGDRYGRWWQTGSAFVDNLVRDIGADPVAAPVKQPYSVLTDLRLRWNRLFGSLAREVPAAQKVDGRIFHWSGDNSETARREAGERLLAHLIQVNRDCGEKEEFHVIAHSHGGNVLWQALGLATRRAVPLPRLGRCITVGTPFLRFRWDISTFIRTLILLVLLVMSMFPFPWKWSGVVGKPWDWFWNYWSRFDGVSPHSAGGNFALAVVLGASLIILLCLSGRAGWETYCYSNSKTVIPGDRRRIEFSDMVWGWLSLILFAMISILSWIVCAVSLDGPVSANFRTAWLIVFSWRGAMGLIASCIILATFCTTVILLCVSVLRALDEKRRIREGKEAWKSFGSRALLIAAPNDEAITGLKAVQVKPPGPLIPRIPAPRVNRYGKLTKRARDPESERLRDRWFPSRTLEVLFLPMVLFQDWVLRPLYNDVFAELLDSFVIRRLWKKAHGCDLFGVVPDKVLTGPLEEEEVEGEPLRVFHPVDVEPLTEEPLRRAIRGIRAALGRDYPVGVYLVDFFKRAMQGCQTEEQALIHTSYFAPGSAETRKAIVEAVKGGKSTATSPITAPQAGPPIDPRQADPGMYGFVTWGVRTTITMLAVSLPWLLVLLLTYAVFYRHSGLYYLTRLRVDDAIVHKNLSSFCRISATPEQMAFGYYVWLANKDDLLEEPTELINEAELNPGDRARGLVRLDAIRKTIEGQFTRPLPPLPRASLDDVKQFAGPWSDTDIDHALKPGLGSQWRRLRFEVTDEILSELAGFDGHKERLASIDGWLSRRNAKSPSDTNVEVAIQLLVEHASIFWRVRAQRESAINYLGHAQTVLQRQRALDSEVYQRTLLLLSVCMARMGEYERAFGLLERLDSTLKISFAVAALFAERNRPWSNDLDGRFSYCMDSDQLKSAIKALPTPTP